MGNLERTEQTYYLLKENARWPIVREMWHELFPYNVRGAWGGRRSPVTLANFCDFSLNYPRHFNFIRKFTGRPRVFLIFSERRPATKRQSSAPRMRSRGRQPLDEKWKWKLYNFKMNQAIRKCIHFFTPNHSNPIINFIITIKYLKTNFHVLFVSIFEHFLLDV